MLYPGIFRPGLFWSVTPDQVNQNRYIENSDLSNCLMLDMQNPMD